MPVNVISGFGKGAVSDLAGLTFASGGSDLHCFGAGPKAGLTLTINVTRPSSVILCTIATVGLYSVRFFRSDT